MCSKLLIRKGKRNRACSSPQKEVCGLSAAEKLSDGESLPLIDDFHAIVLFEVPSCRAQILSARPGEISREIMRLEGLHSQQLRLAQASGQICHYEWMMEHAKKTHIYQTSLIPLSGPQGQVGHVLSVTKNITDWGASRARELHEGALSPTFSQILITARENEKREIAKALHDEIGSASVMLLALVSLAKQSLEQGSKKQTLQHLDQLHRQIQASMGRLHTIIVSLRPPSLDTDGALRGSLEELLDSVCRLGHVKYRLEFAQDWQEKGLCDSVKILLYRVVQEAVNNVIKHAHATRVTVSVKRSKSRVILTVQDDGVGFKREKRLSVKHVGLLSMRDSVRSVGGHLTLQTAPGQGTFIRAVCPCVIYEENL